MELRYKAHRKASTQLKGAAMKAAETSLSGGVVSTETLIKPTYSRRRLRSKSKLEINTAALDLMDELDEKQRKGKSKKAKVSGPTEDLQLVIKHGPIVFPDRAPPASSSETEKEGPVVFPTTCEDCDGNMAVVLVDYNIIRHNYMETAICMNEECGFVYPRLRVAHYYLPKEMQMKTEAEEDEEAEEELTGYDSIAEFEAGCDELERTLNKMEKEACQPIRVSAATQALNACLPFAQDKAPAQLETCFPNGIPVLPQYAYFEHE